MQEMLRRGILMQSSHNVSFAHGDAEIDALLRVYDDVLPVVANAIHNDAMDNHLTGPVMEPLFQVR